MISREEKEDRVVIKIRRDGFEEIEPVEEFAFYRQSEVGRYQMSLD
jgi:hypothetical protein